MRDNGYTVKVEDDQNRAALRDRYDVPLQIQSCHTAIVDGYIIEGHVPVDEIERLLAERPDIVGLAVIGMPSAAASDSSSASGIVSPKRLVIFLMFSPLPEEHLSFSRYW